MAQNDYDPVGGHTKEEADAAYEALFRELHDGNVDSDCSHHDHAEPVFAVTARDADTDCICAAICYALLKNLLFGSGSQTRVFRACTPTPIRDEIHGALKRFGAQPPEILPDVAAKEVILIGTSNPALAPAGIADAHILEIIDTHALGGLTTSAPVCCRIEPLGAVSTLVCKCFLESSVEPDAATATLLCLGIVQATRFFTTPETTRLDRALAATLANAAAIDLADLVNE